MLRTNIIKKYLTDQDVYGIIGHDMLVYLMITIKYFVLLAAVRMIRYLLEAYIISYSYITRFAAGMGIIIYAKGLYDIADEYLDSLVITNRGLVLFRRNGLFSYTTDYLQWVSIEALSDEQNTFWDTLFKKGNIKIRLEDEKYTFPDVGHPAEQVNKLLHRKEKILGRYQYHENETATEVDPKDKYELLVEALGEVVTEYVEKKKEQY